MIRAETMSEKGDSGLTIGSVAGLLHAELSRMGRILGATQAGGEKRQDQQRCSVLGQDLHGVSLHGR